MELHRGGSATRVTDLILRPACTGLRMLCFQGGWRDGWRGLILAGLYACYVFSKYAKLWELGLGAERRAPSAEEQAPCAEPAEPRAANGETPPGA
jgi:hypothetical protein